MTHQHVQSNSLIQLSLSTALLSMSHISGPKSQPCGSRSSRVSLPCRTSQRTQWSSTMSSHNWTIHVGGAGGCNNQPPPTGRYDRIKAELIRCLSLSEGQYVRQLLMHEEVGDLRPTRFLRHLRTFACPSIPSHFLCTLWTNRLPPNIQAIIAT